MINFGDYNPDYLPQFTGECIDGIRVAFHKKDLQEAAKVCKKVSDKGYKLFMQPMVTNSYSDRELLELIEIANKLKPYAFYIVDSFGVIKRNDLLRLFYLVDNNLDKDIYIGYHSHNNLQLAYSNAQAIIEINTKRKIIIDSSVLGMGRGAGNLNTELFVQHLNDSVSGNYKIYPLLKIIDEVLNKIYSTNYWGYSLPHYLSSACNCHPNYASYLSEKNTLSVKSISEILSLIKEDKKVEFDNNYIEELYLIYQKNNIDDIKYINKLKNLFSGKNIVVIAPGISIDRYHDEIKNVINRDDTIAISVNFIPQKLNCEFVFISNEKRFNRIIESRNLDYKEISFIVTSNISLKLKNHENMIVNYRDLINNTNSVKDNSTLMLLKLFINFKCKKSITGCFDGYSYDDNNNNYIDEEMVLPTSRNTMKKLNEGIAKVLSELYKEIQIDFITPTKYSYYTEGCF
jgi:4-hydroxy 2-oxovalerate aldolase